MLGNRHVQLGGHDVGKLLKAQSRVVAVSALGNFLAVLRPKIPEHQIRAVGCRKLRQAIDSAMLADPISDADVVRMSFLAKSRVYGLLGGEETLLRFGGFVQPSLRVFEPVFHAQSPNLLGELYKILVLQSTI